jgi:hypothetical protein
VGGRTIAAPRGPINALGGRDYGDVMIPTPSRFCTLTP